MTTREDLVNQMDSLKESIVKLIDENEKMGSEAEELRTARREAEEKAWEVEEKLTKLENDHERLKSEKEETESQVQTMEQELQDLRSKMSDIESAKDEAESELKRERDQLKSEMDQITGQLERVSELYREASAEKEKLKEKVDVSDLLAIYITLLETVFYGKPHARILYTLHDVGTPITRRNLASSTGIQPAAVLKAIHDLQNADLVSYDDESQETALIKDILR